MEESEYIRCEKCKRLFLQSDDNCCPYCGKRISGTVAENVEKPPLIARQINGKMFAVLAVIVVINIIAALISMLSNISVYSAAVERVGSEEFKLVQQYVESGMITDAKTVESVQLVVKSFNVASVLVWFICIANGAAIAAGVLMLLRFRWSFKVGIVTAIFGILVQIADAICGFAVMGAVDIAGTLAYTIPKLALILLLVIFNEKAMSPQKRTAVYHNGEND